jgi:carbon monoxide dehydrogenase subunit G
VPGFTRSLTIDAPPAKVFAALTDLAQAPQWMPAIQRTEWVRGDKVGPGAEWKETRLSGKRTLTADIKVVRCQASKALDLRVDAKPFGMDLGFDLLPSGKGTQVDYHCHGRGKGLMSLFTKAIMAQVERQDDDLLLRLKAHVEAAQRAEPAQAAGKPKAAKA